MNISPLLRGYAISMAYEIIEAESIPDKEATKEVNKILNLIGLSPITRQESEEINAFQSELLKFAAFNKID